jgi:phage/plasmid primase-like uncharacterized protein
MIAMHDTLEQFRQAITADGEKRFHPGGRIKGCYHSAAITRLASRRAV